MKIYEDVDVPATTRRQVKSRKCDLCGKESKGYGDTEWSRSSFDINETAISIDICQRDGVQYPEGGSGTKTNIDICPECFKDKLVPWLNSQGADIKPEEWDW